VIGSAAPSARPGQDQPRQQFRRSRSPRTCP